MSDTELLRLFAHAGDQDAFSHLLRRHVDLVFSAALRQTRNDPLVAEDITQVVFADLARKSAELLSHPHLVGWLYSCTRLSVAEFHRSQLRRVQRECLYASMTPPSVLPSFPSDDDELRAALDEALAELSEPDRTAILLRFFEGLSHSEVGRRLGTAPNAARMRVARALDSLRNSLERRGIASTAGALGSFLAAHAVEPAPSGLLARLEQQSTLTPGSFLQTTPRRSSRRVTPTWIPAAVLIAISLGVFSLLRLSNTWLRNHPSKPISDATSRLEVDSAGLSPNPTQLTPTASKGATPSDFDSEDILKLTVVAKETGEPIPNGPLDHLVRFDRWPAEVFSHRVPTTEAGEAWIPRSTNAQFVQITTRIDGFADTRLRWEPRLGQTIPTQYTLRLEPAVALGGRVLDPDGNPLEGATVSVDQEPRPSENQGPENHELGSVSTVTDASGRWRLSRVAADHLERCSLGASHPDHQPSETLTLRSSPSASVELQNGTHVLRLKPSRHLKGRVVDPEGQGIADALVGPDPGSRRSTRTAIDGFFELRGWPVSNQWITASAPGFGPARFPVPADQSSVTLTLQVSGLVRFRVVDVEGKPLPNVAFGYSNNPWETSSEAGYPPPPSISAFRGITDEAGRGQWSDAPAGSTLLDFLADGHERRFAVRLKSDGSEQEVILQPAVDLVVHGAVKDANTGRLIPSFQLAAGQLLTMNPMREPPLLFTEQEGDWARFEGGYFRHRLTGSIAGIAHPQVVIRLEADGFQPWYSRPLQINEGEVRLDANLKPAREFSLTILQPNGQPAAEAQVGLLRKGDTFSLQRTRFNRNPLETAGFSYRTADSAGRVHLSEDEEITTALIVHSGGFSRVPFATLNRITQLQLQPWGRLEVEFTGVDRANDHAWLQPADPLNADLTLEFDTAHQKAATDRRCRFDYLPPGEWVVHQVRPNVQTGGGRSYPPGQSKSVHVVAGETLSVKMGDAGSRISGTLLIPQSEAIEGEWVGSLRAINDNLPKPPPEIVSDSRAFAEWRLQPGIREKLEEASRRNRFVTIGEDRQFVIDSVEPGRYELVFFSKPTSPNAKIRPVTRKSLEVTPDLQGGELNLGVIEAVRH
ncbi:MAG: sigma-70 family RNA polymerase sigma factor [Verrucomicrobia bacterium]|nr:sigma-70 family RNA polymerase sigma factor [Verrucomicrobiota bacterium]